SGRGMSAEFNTVERARHRWHEILPLLGIESRFLTNKHGPCPLCRGKDRFRFDDRDGSGSYYCNQCGAGTGVILVSEQKGWNFRTACEEIDKIMGTASAVESGDLKPRKDDRKRRAETVRRALTQAIDAAVVEAYLTRRGITTRSPALRGHACCPYFGDDR